MLFALFISANASAINESAIELAPQTADFMEIAKAFVERRNEALVEPVQEIVALRIEPKQETSKTSVSNVPVYESKEILSDEERVLSELDERRGVLSQYNEAYTHFENEMTLVSSSIDGDTATLVIEEYTKLYYEKILGDEPEYTAWVTEREFVFEKGSQGWSLQSQRLLNDQGPAPINEATNVTQKDMLTALTKVSRLYAENDAEISVNGKVKMQVYGN